MSFPPSPLSEWRKILSLIHTTLCSIWALRIASKAEICRQPEYRWTPAEGIEKRQKIKINLIVQNLRCTREEIKNTGQNRGRHHFLGLCRKSNIVRHFTNSGRPAEGEDWPLYCATVGRQTVFLPLRFSLKWSWTCSLWLPGAALLFAPVKTGIRVFHDPSSTRGAPLELFLHNPSSGV